MLLVCGEALIDMIGTPTAEGQMFRPVIGGSPLNVAMGLARLDRRVAFLSKLSTDYFGRELAAFVDREGIDARYLRRDPARPTTLAFVALGAGGHPVYSFYGNDAADRCMTAADVPEELPAEIGAVHFGSIALAQEPTATTLVDFMRRIAPSRVVALDPNVRPSIIPDRAVWLERLDAMIGLADIVKASAEDIEWIAGADADFRTVAADWSRRGPAFVIVTDGPRGAVLARDGRCRAIEARPIEVVDTVGAGDTFQAAMLARLEARGLLEKSRLRSASESELDDALRFAITAAGITCGRRGADLPQLAEVEAAL